MKDRYPIRLLDNNAELPERDTVLERFRQLLRNEPQSIDAEVDAEEGVESGVSDNNENELSDDELAVEDGTYESELPEAESDEADDATYEQEPDVESDSESELELDDDTDSSEDSDFGDDWDADALLEE